MPDLFSSYTLKGVTLRNRTVMSPMTMYNSVRPWTPCGPSGQKDTR